MQIKTIAIASTCFKEKFCIPRQAGLAPASFGSIKLISPYDREEALRGLETFSHIIITWIPHLAKVNESLTIKPPRLGGNKKLGVFATRSPFRPNPICTSIVKVESIKFDKAIIDISNHDLLDQTPIIDIKPYIPQWDITSEASNGWIDNHKETRIEVSFKNKEEIKDETRDLITQLLSLNPRPRYQEDKLSYAFKLDRFDIHFQYLNDHHIEVTKITSL